MKISKTIQITMLSKLTLVSAFVMICMCSTAQYKFKIIADNNQIRRDELPDAHKLLCDGVWSIPGNSGGDKGWAIPIAEWQTGYNGMGPGFLVTEDYWKNYPSKNYDLTKAITSTEAIKMVCGYAEPSKPNDDHTTTVINNDVIDDLYQHSGAKVIVLARSYQNGNWKNEVSRALSNNKVSGVCFEQKPDVNRYKSFKILDGIKATIDAGKNAFLLLPPHFATESTNYSADLKTLFDYIKANKSVVLESENLYFVPNCYNRLKNKTTTMYGGEDSVEGAIKLLKQLRENSATSIHTATSSFTAKVFPSVVENEVNIELNSLNQSRCKIYNLMGKELISVSLNELHTKLDISEFPTGMYLVVIESDTEKFTTKIIVQ